MTRVTALGIGALVLVLIEPIGVSGVAGFPVASSDSFQTLWIGADGRLTRNARDALAVIASAADDGLDPADYDRDQLGTLSACIDRGDRSPNVAAELARRLTAAVVQYLQDLHLGRVDPRTIGFELRAPADRHDFAVELRSALVAGRLRDAAAGLRPSIGQYGALRGKLAQYRSLAAGPHPDALAETAVVRPGEPYAGVAVLKRLLVASGDLPASADVGVTYSGAIVDGVRRFQMRHGLESDGVLGRRTQGALRIPVEWRVRQIELALERLRWLPHHSDQRLIVLNIPMFRLWAWSSSPATAAPALAMDVIVGRAIGTRTPVFVADMREVIFRPYWNVPPSILRGEILPKLDRDPAYLRRENMEVVRGQGDDATPLELTADNVAALRRGQLRVRQRPGPQNSLGLIKFVFPNDDNVYMHGTPAQALFSRSRRDFSHGCVRLKDPVAMAEWVLDDQEGWGRERIVAAMSGPQSLRVDLQRPIRVVLFYTTAAVTPDDDSIHFAEDIYGHDVKLDRALATRRAR